MTQPTIVCATDLGPDGARLVDFATLFAGAMGGRLVLLHATDSLDDGEHPPHVIAAAIDALRGRVRGRRAEAEAALEVELARAGSSGVPVEGKLADGPPWRAIVDTTTELGASLLVVGRRKRAEWLAGPTVDRVVRHAPCATLVAPPDVALPKTLDSVRWLVGCDFSEPSRRALSLVRDIARGRAGSIVLAYVLDPPMETYRVGLHPEADRAQALARVEPQVIGRVRADLTTEAASVFGEAGAATIGHEILIGRPPDALCEAAARFRADVIVTGTTGRSGVPRLLLGSVAEGVVRHGPVPVLVVH